MKQIIVFNKNISQPVYIQVSQQIISAIQRKLLSKGTVLPGTRKLSSLLNIHRNTAVAIYDELASQGWVKIIPNKGTYILGVEDKPIKIKTSSKTTNYTNTPAKTTGFPFQQSFHLASTAQLTTATYTINDGKPDLRLHPTHQFTRWYSAAMKRKTLIQKWNRPTEFSYSLFRTQLCNYLNATRGFNIRPNNIISTRSTEMSLYIVSQLIIKPNDIVLVGKLSNYASNMIFQQAAANIKTIPIDCNGLDVNYIKNNFTKGSIRCVYVCAQRDYPTGVTLSIKRRLELMELAKNYGFAIIEDDYDYDFQYEGSAILPMASDDVNGMVIYLGKFGQSLFPSFQTGFVVAPKNLISEANNYLQLLDNQGDFIQEQMLSELIYEGEINRLMKKNMFLYKKRRDFTSKLLDKHFKNIAQWQIPSGGLAIWLTFSPKIALVQLANEALKNNLFLPKTILYQNKETCAIRFGFGHLNLQEITVVIELLKKAYYGIL